MNDWLASEAIIRTGIFVVLLGSLLSLETLRPSVNVALGWRREGVNLALGAINILVLRLAFPWLAVDLAMTLQAHSWGLLAVLEGPQWLTVPVGFLLLDLSVYWQHRAFHWLPVLWRFHRVHHCDPGVSTTTALRFHPGEAVLSMVLKLLVILLIGAPPLAVLLFEVALSSGALFSHANVRLSARLDRFLGAVIVTPDMHRVHHSVKPDETNSNYGFFLAVWDRMFNTRRYVEDVAQVEIGLTDYREQSHQRLPALLRNPFS